MCYWGSPAVLIPLEWSISLNTISGSYRSVWRLSPAVMAAKSGAPSLGNCNSQREFIPSAPPFHIERLPLFDDVSVGL